MTVTPPSATIARLNSVIVMIIFLLQSFPKVSQLQCLRELVLFSSFRPSPTVYLSSTIQTQVRGNRILSRNSLYLLLNLQML